MANKNYIVSAHGGRYKGEHPISVPVSFEVVFFVYDRITLSNNNGWRIYKYLINSNHDHTKVKGIANRKKAGDTGHNYYCWNYPQIGQASGIYEVGAGIPSHPKIDLSIYNGKTKPSSLSLSTLFQTLNPVTIYWVACRSAS